MARKPISIRVINSSGELLKEYARPDDAAEAMGVSRNVIYTWLNGRVKSRDGNKWEWAKQPKAIGPRKSKVRGNPSPGSL